MLTQRLELELLMPDHAEALFHGLSDKRLYKFVDDEPPASIESLRRRYERLVTRKSPDGVEIWLNWAVRTLQPPVYIGYVQATIRKNGWAEIAFVLFHEFWGQGYGKESVTAMLQELNKTYFVSNFRAFVNPRNWPSRGLLQSLGFELSGREVPLQSRLRGRTGVGIEGRSLV